MWWSFCKWQLDLRKLHHTWEWLLDLHHHHQWVEAFSYLVFVTAVSDSRCQSFFLVALRFLQSRSLVVELALESFYRRRHCWENYAIFRSVILEDFFWGTITIFGKILLIYNGLDGDWIGSMDNSERKNLAPSLRHYIWWEYHSIWKNKKNWLTIKSFLFLKKNSWL